MTEEGGGRKLPKLLWCHSWKTFTDLTVLSGQAVYILIVSFARIRLTENEEIEISNQDSKAQAWAQIKWDWVNEQIYVLFSIPLNIHLQ
jgi:hypothetical protein